MKKAFLVFALLLAFTLVFVACGGNGDDPAPAEPGQVTEPGTGEEPAPTGPAPGMGNIHPIQDFGGRTLRVAAWWADPQESLFQWSNEPPDPFEAANYHLARLQWENSQRVQEQFNVRFQAVEIPFDDYFEMIATSVLAGDPIADLIVVEGWMQLVGMQGNLIRPFQSVPNSDLFGAQNFAAQSTVHEGEVWTMYPSGPFGSGWGIGVNLDIIEAEGLPNPVDLYYAGEWNWDNMLHIMREATRSTDGTGIINQFGFAGNPGGGNTGFITHFIAANDGVQVNDDLNYGFDHPNTVRALELVHTIFTEGLWASDNGNWSDDWSRNFFSGMREGNAALFLLTTWAPADAGGIDFEFRWVPIPQGPDNISGNTWATGWRQSLGLTAASEWGADEILIIMEELLSWSIDDPELLWESGHYIWMGEVYQTQGCIDRGVQIGLQGRVEVGLDVTGYSYVLNAMASAFWDGYMDVMQAIEYHRGPFQEMLDFRFR